jgi:hypothetical protein
MHMITLVRVPNFKKSLIFCRPSTDVFLSVPICSTVSIIFSHCSRSDFVLKCCPATQHVIKEENQGFEPRVVQHFPSSSPTITPSLPSNPTGIPLTLTSKLPTAIPTSNPSSGTCDGANQSWLSFRHACLA